MNSGLHTVLLLVDALRWDYLNPSETPYLCSLADSPHTLSGRTQEPFGFQTRPAFFAGLYPEASDISTMFVYSPRTSPYRPLRYYPHRLIRKLPRGRDRLESFIRRKMDMHVRNTSMHSALPYYANSVHVPLELLPAFDFSERELPWSGSYVEAKSLFDILSENQYHWLYLGWPLVIDNDSDQEIVEKCIEDAAPHHRFIYVHLSQLDLLGHSYGPHSPQIRRGLRNIDMLIEDLIIGLQSRLNNQDLDLIVFGDHGMVEVRETVDITTALRGSQAVLGKHYIMFLDSTMARFWFLDGRYATEILSILEEFGDKGGILTRQESVRYRIRFGNRKFWDSLWLARDGVLIHPSFFHVDGEPPRGMHGYAPDCLGNQGAFLLQSHRVDRRRRVNSINMVDIFPTLLRLMNLPIPRSNQGNALV